MNKKLTKILLIDPPGFVVGVNTGLAYLAGSLLNKGYELQILDFNNYQDDINKRLKDQLKKEYDIIGFSLKSLTIVKALPIVKKCRKWSPKSLIIAGGPGVTVEQENFLKQFPFFDYALFGEGELSILEFIEYLNGQRQIEKVRGLIYKVGKQIVLNENNFIANLDDLAFPDYSVFDKLSFKKNTYPLVTSRGCPYNCLYCAVNLVSGKKFRSHSPQRIIEELTQAIKKYKINKFEIYDDTFTQDITRAKIFCRLLIKKKLFLFWACNNGIRADRIDRELLKLMKKAGCCEIWLGIESLDADVFALVNKGEKVDTILKTICLAKKEGIKVSGFFIIGLPGSTYLKDQETLRKANKLGLHATTWSLATPFPHTNLWEWSRKNAKILRNYNDVSFSVDPKCTFETIDYPEEERLAMFYKANLAFNGYTCLASGKNMQEKIGKIIKIIWKYERKKLPYHIVFGGFSLFAQKIFPKIFRKIDIGFVIHK